MDSRGEVCVRVEAIHAYHLQVCKCCFKVTNSTETQCGLMFRDIAYDISGKGKMCFLMSGIVGLHEISFLFKFMHGYNESKAVGLGFAS